MAKRQQARKKVWMERTHAAHNNEEDETVKIFWVKLHFKTLPFTCLFLAEWKQIDVFQMLSYLENDIIVTTIACLIRRAIDVTNCLMQLQLAGNLGSSKPAKVTAALRGSIFFSSSRFLFCNFPPPQKNMKYHIFAKVPCLCGNDPAM